MRELIKFWKDFYYIEPVLEIVLCITLLISLSKKGKSPNLKYIPLYTLSLLLVFLLNALYISRIDRSNSKLLYGLVDYFDYFFTLAEFLIFSDFYFQLISNITIKKLIPFIRLLFLSFFIYMLITDRKFYAAISEQTQNMVYTIEGILLLLLCLSYFVELFKKPPSLNLKNDPSFWVSTGLLLFLTCTLPFSLLENYIRKHHNHLLYWTYPVFYLFYTLLFLMIIRAYLCKPGNKTTISLSVK